MNYYKISTAWEPEIIGVNNGTCQAELIHKKFKKEEDYKELAEFFNHFTYWTKQDHRPNKQFNFEYIKLFKKAKVTDLISCTPRMMGIEFFLNSKAKQLLDGLNLPNSYFFDASIYTYDKKKLNDQYFALYTTYLGFETIDFNKTVFFSGSKMSGKTYYHFENYESWKKYRDDPKTLHISTEKIGLKKEFGNADFIETRLGGPFVSERLLDRWTNFDIKGFEINKEPTLDLV